jgi:triacylglycerol esterase/lipase EstA (alpha/beta hydrolase family)
MYLVLAFEILLLLNNCIVSSNEDISSSSDILPVVIIHGILSSPDKLTYFKEELSKVGLTVYLINVSKYDVKPEFTSISTNMNVQLNMVYNEIKQLNVGLINLIGLSQGGLLARGYVQWYPSNVNNLITINSPHGGIYFNSSTNLMSTMSQLFLSFSNYWRDPFNYNEYLKKSSYLAKLNNEVNNIFENISCNKLKKLNNFVMFWSPNDEIISPPESGKFSTFELNKLSVINNLSVINITNAPYYLPLCLDKVNYSIYETSCSHYGLVDNSCIDQIIPILINYLIGWGRESI